jgi:diketogulonate reductase-like aldo/keto reductase
MKGTECQRAVEAALACGYRHIDTADIYGNQDAVGAAIRSAGVPREELFLTSKVWRDHLRQDDVLRSCDRICRQLGIDMVDLLLIHWPNKEIHLAETLRAMNRLIELERIRACGVSNFTAPRLEHALSLGIVPISVNQVEYHPFLNQKSLHRFCQEQEVVVTAYAPLAQGKVAEEPAIQQVAERYGKTPAQITLRWLIQRGIAAIPKASRPEHIESNFQVFDFELSEADFQILDSLDRGLRLLNWDVAEFDR